jgi:acetyl esterase/lipase
MSSTPKVGGQSLQLDLYVPQKHEPRPRLLVWVHGGGWHEGSRTGTPLLGATTHGYAVATMSYRFSQVAKFPAQIHDCKGVIRWLRAHAAEYGYDASRIGVCGISAGGHLVSLLGASAGNKQLEGDVGGNLDQPSSVQAVIDMCGPSDFLTLASNDFLAKPGGVLFELFGGPVADKAELATLASPVTHISHDAPPFLIFHGDKDPLVPHEQSVKLHMLLKKAGVDSTIEVFPGGGHVPLQFFDATHAQMMLAFFDKHLN